MIEIIKKFISKIKKKKTNERSYFELWADVSVYRTKKSVSWLGKEVLFLNPMSNKNSMGTVVSEYLKFKPRVRPKIFYTIVDQSGSRYDVYEDCVPTISESKLHDGSSWHTQEGSFNERLGEVSQAMLGNIADKATEHIQNKIRNYCNEWCIQDCSSDCPLKIYKNG